MKKTRTRIMALLGALAMAVWGIGMTGCFTSLDSSDDSPGNRGGAYERLADGGPSGRIAPTAPASQGSITVSETQVLRTTTVALSGGGRTYTKIQDALNAAANMTNPVITLSKGTYKEDGLKYKGNNNLIIKGESTTGYGTDVLIIGQGADMSQESTRSLLSFEGSANIVIQNITLKNSYGETSGTAQAETLGVSNKAFTGTLAVYNCSFLSGQDTICTQGKAWFYKCYIEGDVDFLWMEGQKGEAKVALYEECIIRAIGTRSTSAYLAAPRALASEASVWKGVVLYNSTIQAESGLKNFYLGRNPWAGSTSHYNNVAIVGCRLQLADGVTLHDDIWKSAAHGTSNQQHIGFKTDEYFTKSAAGHGARLTAAQIAADYAGRENILNRYYDTNSTKFKKDAEAYWDVAATVSANGLDVTPDSSQSLLAGEKEVKSKTYDLVVLAAAGSSTDAAGSEDGISWTGLTNSGDNTWKQAKEGATVTFSVTEASVVKLTAYNNGVGTMSATVGGTKVVDNTSACAETAFLTSGAGEVVITFTGQTYFRTITVSTRTDEANKAGAVAVKLGATQIAKTETTTATATVTPYYLNNTGSDAISTDVTWSSSKTSVATINASSGAISGVAAGTTDIIAASKATPSVTGKATLTVTATATTVVPLVTWDFSTDSVTVLGSDKTTEPADKTLQSGTTGYLQGDSANVLIEVAATGKIYARGSDAQINTGTKLHIPVSNGSVVVVKNYSTGNDCTYTLGGTQNINNSSKSQEVSWKATSEGYAELEVTVNGYLYSISVTNVDYSKAHTSAASGILQ